MPLDLAARHWGDGPRSILLLHGITSNGRGWWRLGPDLAENGWRVVAPDLRGHGESPPGDDYALSSYTADVLALGGPWDAVLGHSMGGAIAVLAAVEGSRFADRLILHDPALLIGVTGAEETLGWLLEPYERPQTVQETIEANPTWDPEDARLKAESLLQCSADVVRATVYDNPDWTLITETAALSMPTTVIGGDPAHGGIMPVTIGEWFASESSFIDYVMLPGSGHSAQKETASYDAYLSTVLAALEGRPVREAALEMAVLPGAELDEAPGLRSMTEGGVPG